MGEPKARNVKIVNKLEEAKKKAQDGKRRRQHRQLAKAVSQAEMNPDDYFQRKLEERYRQRSG